jgi:nucleotide-binding universal stress UspA family protein
VILSVSENREEDQSCERLRQALRWHNQNVSVRYLERDRRAPAEILLGEATGPAVGATLLVMGGYGHGRLREALFGGFTRRVLTEADIPVLMAH